MQTSPARPSAVSIPELRAAVRGRVIAPGDPEYDTARSLFYGGMDRHPAALVRVADSADVSRVVTLARDSGSDLAVRSVCFMPPPSSILDELERAERHAPRICGRILL